MSHRSILGALVLLLAFTSVHCTDSNGQDAGIDAAPYDASPSSCGDAICSAQELCVASSALGGIGYAMLDGGGCAPGTLAYGGFCRSISQSYACQPVPAACGRAAPTCGCASSVCTAAISPGLHPDCTCSQAANSTTISCGCSYP